MLIVSGLAAILSAFFVPPGAEYIGYIDFQVLALLFCMMAVVAGLQEIGAFEVLSQFFLRKGKDIKRITLILVLLCFFMAMLVTNDVALLTMVPFTIAVLDFTSEKRLIFVIVLETVAANLGSMLTPVGNPQNLYLFSYFDIPAPQFMGITLPITILSLGMIIIMALSVSSQKITVVFDVKAQIENRHKFTIYILLFTSCLLTVLGILDYRLNLAVSVAVIAFMERRILKKVDYGLLLTFVFFFIFVGNMGRIEAISDLVSQMIQGRELVASALLSQVISNVPAAVMLAPFTENYRDLLLGVNIGGLGTPIASLASLISYKLYARRTAAQKGRYLFVFSVINIVMLIGLLCVEVLIN